MSVLEIGLLVAVAWLSGALVIVMAENKWQADELVVLTFWPFVFPVGLVWKRYARWAYTCRDCKRWYGDRKHYDLHLVHRTKCTVPATEETS